MRLAHLEVTNYRGLKRSAVSLGSMACIVGENNAGKSSLLFAVKLLFSGSAISQADFFDASQPVTIVGRFIDVSSADLNRISNAEHRSRIQQLVNNGELEFCRRYEPDGDGKASLQCLRTVPADPAMSGDVVSGQIKGLRGKAIAERLATHLPEYAAVFATATTQAQATELLESVVAGLPPEQLIHAFMPLPSGIPNSVKDLLPDPIFIPAVKDVKDELKTGESATLGKLVGVLLGQIQQTEEIKRIASALDELNGLLNRVHAPDGAETDNRLSEVRDIEATLLRYLRESFPAIGLELQVPRPEMRAIFSTAQILIDDGVRGSVDSKGDGLKRSVIFALFRTYVAMSSALAASASGGAPYVFLFEEPELYLHPSAQRILFDALRSLSDAHQVLITTHSPLFLSPDCTRTFVKIRKQQPATADVIKKPYAVVTAVDLTTDLPARDAFQLMCFEHNAAAFFADCVALVEGDSDILFLKHVGRVLVADWQESVRGVEFVRIGGKGNYRRFRDFFARFDVRVVAVLDRDVLIEGFDQLEMPDDVQKLRQQFLAELDQMALRDGMEYSATRSQVTQLLRQHSWVQRYTRLKELARQVAAGNVLSESELIEIDLLFAHEQSGLRRQVLDTAPSLPSSIHPLLEALRKRDVAVLMRGAVESYYAPDVSGTDKPTKALSACDKMNTRMAFEDCCPTVTTADGEMLELELILRHIARLPLIG